MGSIEGVGPLLGMTVYQPTRSSCGDLWIVRTGSVQGQYCLLRNMSSAPDVVGRTLLKPRAEPLFVQLDLIFVNSSARLECMLDRDLATLLLAQ